LIRLAVRVSREHSEVVLAELLELSPSGVEEVDRGEEIEYALYGAPGELPTLPDLAAAAGTAPVAISTSEIADDWADRWQQFHQPVVLGDRLSVRPPWEPATDARLDLVIDPGRAFGTGAHATTRMCLELLLELPEDGALLDLGCGSGVLAIAAAGLGFSPVLALDVEEESVEATRANAGANGVDVEVRRFDLRAEAVPDGYGTVVANLVAPLLINWAKRGDGLPQRLIASGLLVEETDPASAAFAAAGLSERRRLERAGWTAMLLERS
jgi:ribosomal protein L11 methyltransferase